MSDIPNGPSAEQSNPEDSFEKILSEFEIIDFSSKVHYFSEQYEIIETTPEESIINTCFVNSLCPGPFLRKEWPTSIKIHYDYFKKEKIYTLIGIIRIIGASDFVKGFPDEFEDSVKKTMPFSTFLTNSIEPNEVKSYEDIWREIMACAVIYSLKDEPNDWARAIYYQEKSAFKAVEMLFGKKGQKEELA